MIHRILKPSKSSSFFIFGARGTGKSTLINEWLKDKKHFTIDFLIPEEESLFLLKPSTLIERLNAQKTDWVFIDEVQKLPKILDIVHLAIEKQKCKFALTGSSARKLKRGSANLLAGRAFVYYLHPFTYFELKEKFNLTDILKWGSLPKIFSFTEKKDKEKYLNSYSLTYIKEEIQQEQLVRNIEPFSKFLPVAAQMNGEILNYSKISREAGIDAKSVERYFQILSDTLIGFFLESYHKLVRKQISQKPKFYFFDIGVTRSLQGALSEEISPSGYGYGKLFEHFFILECIRLNDYFESEYRFSYLRTKDELEIDLIVERGKKIFLIEIKSTSNVTEDHGRHLQKVMDAFPKARKIISCQEKISRKLENGIEILPWQEVLEILFKST
jgi:predicted AAA+ superfamily ATPase